MSENGVKMLEFPQKGDERGHLVIVEGHKDIPFDIKRIFYIYGSDTDVVRGQHANLKSQFVLINVAGKSKVKVKDGLGNEAVFSLTARIQEFIFHRWYGKICMIFQKILFFWYLQVSITIRMNISVIMMSLSKS